MNDRITRTNASVVLSFNKLELALEVKALVSQSQTLYCMLKFLSVICLLVHFQKNQNVGDFVDQDFL